jgi:EAL domain-containing protein (putative c-di-GMP-specific phosphodiesterase class I)
MCDLIGRVTSRAGLKSTAIGAAQAIPGALAAVEPVMVFLDISLERSDAVDGIRSLHGSGFRGAVQLISGLEPNILEAVRSVGERHGLHMLAPIRKPFRLEHLESVVQTESVNSAKRVREQRDPSLAASKAGSPAARVSLSTALERNWLDVQYQPKVDLAFNRALGAEGLARLNHPAHGRLGPASFLPGAGEADLDRLTEFVVLRAFKDWEVVRKAGTNLRLAVNAPVRSLAGARLIGLIRECRPSAEDWPGLIIEVTEGEAIKDIEFTTEAAVQLRIYKVQLAIDDFGSGYSSLARLKELPFAEVKLDRSFVSGCSQDRTKRAMCEAVVDLARRFHITSVAEGVETTDDLQVLVDVGYDVAQGFLFARPMVSGDFIKLIETRAINKPVSP